MAGAEKLELARPRNDCEMRAGGGRQGGRGRVELVGRIGRLRSQNGERTVEIAGWQNGRLPLPS